MAVTRITYYQDPGLTSVPYDVRPYTGGRSFYVQNSYIPYHYNPTLYTAPPNYIMDASNPLQINSAVDAVFNQAALNQISATDFQTHIPVLDELLGGAINFLKEQDVPGQLDLADVLQVPLGSAYYSRRATLDPIIGKAVSEKGLDKLSGFADAGANILINFSDTMDVLANPIKGMFLEKEGALKGLERGLGVGSEGRYAYNYNTGNPVSDFGLELISDPFNWIDFGTSSIAKLVAKGGASALKTAVSETAQQLGKNLSDDAAQFLVNRALKFVRKKPDDLVGAMADTVKAAAKPGFGREAIDIAAHPAYSELLQNNLTNAARNNMNVAVLSSLRKMNEASNIAQSTLMKSVGWTSGLTPSFKIARLITDPIAGATYNAWLRSRNGATLPNNTLPITEFEPAILKFKKDASGLPCDEVDDWQMEAWRIEKADTISQDTMNIYGLVRSSSNPLRDANAYFAQRVNTTFDEYVTELERLANQYPSLEYHYNDMRTIQAMIAAVENAKANQALLKKLRTDLDVLEATIASIERLRLRNQGSLERPDLLIKLANMLDNMSADATTTQSVREITMRLKDYLKTAEDLALAPPVEQTEKTLSSLEDYLRVLSYQYAQTKNYIFKTVNILTDNKTLQQVDLIDELLTSQNWGELATSDVQRIAMDISYRGAQYPDLKKIYPRLYDGSVSENLMITENSLKELRSQHTQQTIKLQAFEELIRNNELAKAKMQDWRNPGFQRALDNLQLQIRNRIDKLTDAVKTHEEDVRKSVFNNDYLTKLDDAYKAGMDAPFKNLVEDSDESISLEVERAEISGFLLEKQMPKITSAYEKFMREINITRTYISGEFKKTVSDLRVLINNFNAAPLDTIAQLFNKVQTLDADSVYAFRFIHNKIEKALRDFGIEYRVSEKEFQQSLLDIAKWDPIKGKLFYDAIGDLTPHLDAALEEVSNMAVHVEQDSYTSQLLDVLDNAMQAFEKDPSRNAKYLYDQLQALPVLSTQTEVMLEELTELINVQDVVHLHSIKSGLTEYAFKESQVFAAKQLLDTDISGAATDYAEQIILKTGIGTTLQQLSANEDYAPLVNSLRGRAYAHQSYTALLTSLLNDPILKNVASNIIDTLQHWKTRLFDKLFVNRARFYEEFVGKVQSQLTAITAEHNALDTLFAEGTLRQHVFEQWLADNKFNITHAHDAEYDNLRVLYLLQNNGIKLDTINHIPVIFDIETTGLGAGRDQILQIAWRTLDGRSGNLLSRVTANLIPEHTTLAKLTDAKLSYQDQVSQYLARWANPENPTQDELLKQFAAQLRALEAEGNPAGSPLRSVQLVGWNNSIFDKPFIDETAARLLVGADYHTSRYLAGLPVFDGLTKLQEIQGAVHLTTEQIQAIQKYLQIYMDRRWAYESEIPRNMRFIDTIDGGFASDLKKVAKEIDVLETNAKKIGGVPDYETSELADAFGVLNQSFRGASKELNDAANAIFDTLQDIRAHNAILDNRRIFKDNASGIFYDYKGHVIELPGVHNTTQIMATREGVLPQGAVKIRYSSSVIERIFEGAANRSVDRTALDKYFKFARGVSRLSDAVQNTHLATMYYDDFGKATENMLIEIKELYKEVPILSVPTFLQDVNPYLTGTFDRYAQAQQLYSFMKRLANGHGLSPDMKTFLARQKANGFDDVFRIFAQPKNMLNSQGRMIEDEFTDTFFHLNMQPLLSNGTEYLKEMKDDLIPIAQRIDQMGALRDVKDLKAASSQAGLAVLTRFYKSWKRIGAWLMDVPDDKSHMARILDGKFQLLSFAEHTALSQLEWLAKLPADKFEKYMWIANGRATFGVPANTAPMYEAFMKGIFDMFQKRADELAANNVHLYYDASAKRMFLWLDNSDNVILKWRSAEMKHSVDEAARVTAANAAKLATEEREIFKDFGADLYQDITPYFRADQRVAPELMQAYHETKDLMATLTRNRNIGTLGDMGSRAVMEAIDQKIPAVLQNRLIPISVFAEAEHFNTFNFNRSNLGLLSSRQELTKFVSGNIIKNYMNSAQALGDVMDTRTKMMYMFFDDAHSLSKGFYSELSPEEIYAMLQKHSELRLAGLIADKKYGSIVQSFKADSVEHINYYLQHPELNITIMPIQTFLQAHNAINNFYVGGSLMRQAYHWIVGPTKTGYLTSLGFVFRNIVDSTIKNILLAGSPTEAGNMVRHTLETAKYYQRYREILRKVQNFSDDTMYHASGMFSKQVLHHLYETSPAEMNALMSEDLFQLIHDFVEQGPSAGLSKIQRDAIKAQQYRRLDRKGLPRPAKDLADILTENMISQPIMSANSYLEQIFRLSGYTWALKEGRTTDAAMQMIFKNHFDYSAKSKAEMYAEYVVPFNSFMTSNMKFWMDAVDRYGWVGGMYRDFYSSFWDFENRDEDEISRNRSLQFQILAGNLVFDNNVVLKLSPSAMDAFRLMSDPSEILGRLAFYLRIPLEVLVEQINGQESDDFFKTLMTNMPLIGPALYKLWPEDGMIAKNQGRVKGDAFERAAGKVLVTVLPSIFGAIQTWDDYNYEYNRQTHPKSRKVKKPYVRKAYPMRNSNPRGRRSRRTYARKTYATKSYVPKLYGQYTMAKIVSNVRKTQMRMPDVRSPLSRSTPGLYRRLYTGAGRSRFKSRMVQVTSRNLAARLRSDWIYVR